jgi:hypothetical protein
MVGNLVHYWEMRQADKKAYWMELPWGFQLAEQMVSGKDRKKDVATAVMKGIVKVEMLVNMLELGTAAQKGYP